MSSLTLFRLLGPPLLSCPISFPTSEQSTRKRRFKTDFESHDSAAQEPKFALLFTVLIFTFYSFAASRALAWRFLRGWVAAFCWC